MDGTQQQQQNILREIKGEVMNKQEEAKLAMFRGHIDGSGTNGPSYPDAIPQTPIKDLIHNQDDAAHETLGE